MSDATPVVFLCHASDDKPLVERLATDLRAHGIDVFYDRWEIRAGDSLRQKIDEGLGRCTHFVAVLSTVSIRKPWVNAEMDAGFVQRLEGEVTFIPLRLGLRPEDLPPLLRGIHSPSIDDYEKGVAALAADIHGVTLKPPLGPKPAVVETRTQESGLSPAAEALARLLVERSRNGLWHDPQLSVPEIKSTLHLGDDDLADAVDELEGHGFVGKHSHLGCGPLGFDAVYPMGELFVAMDPICQAWDPEVDAVTLATKAMDLEHQWMAVDEAAKALGWEPRRMNPALYFLMNRDLVQFRKSMGSHPWATPLIGKTAETRRFLRSRR